MARGRADFDGHALRVLRATRAVDGRLLSAAALAARVGTSKARILAYENNRSVPEPARIAELARVFKVPPDRLSASDARHLSVRDLRVHAGLTAEQVAASLGVSRRTYRDVESMARLPVRDDGTLRIRLAACLGVPLGRINRALHHHPLAIARRAQIADHLTALFQRAHRTHVPAVVTPDDERLRAVAALVQRVPTVVCRLVNNELVRYRRLLRGQAMAELEAAYAEDEHAARQAKERRRRFTGLVETAPARSAEVLSSFLAEAMSARQWRAMVSLVDTGAEGIAVRHPSDADAGVWNALLERSFVTRVVHVEQGVHIHVLSSRGLNAMRGEFRMYACLYPRVATPLLFRHLLVATQGQGKRGPRREGRVRKEPQPITTSEG
ncbi:helix-turn-helix domain-containing protein [Streptomyces sp. UNOB3_S3]|uniref:helix-turn-helix domain-containing protein n=1 Tax=Streptomyces sp. UNOB3_S3 TaxID=2871682 RepID=UPI001E5C8F0F|nr:helix-turn-helix domain-containing protein [Streptomyces sp. UNOB3_S3]MCC3774022.1 helix-turn-helix domain-containing protein [Streptomyces sp. UNOB3_S3]